MKSSDLTTIHANMDALRIHGAVLIPGVSLESGETDVFHCVTIGDKYYELNAVRHEDNLVTVTAYAVDIDGNGVATLNPGIWCRIIEHADGVA